MNSKKPHSSSFRDPSGYIFIENNQVNRVVNPVYFKQYEALKSSGFYDLLIRNELLIPHKEILATADRIVLHTEYIDFVTYPYEWSFNMYKAAALLTLKVQKLAVEYGFSLKDATAFNITFYKGNAIFIDTLSFDFYVEDSPWRAYKQFVMHFLGPLLSAKHFGSDSLGYLKQFIDGIPLQMLSSMLPIQSRFNPTVLTNVHLLAKSEAKYNEEQRAASISAKLSKKGLLNIVENLYGFIKNLKLKENSEWGNYYDKLNYSNKAFKHKSEVINAWVSELKPETIIDVGGNDGTFVRKLTYQPIEALVCDVDNNAVDENFKLLKQNEETHITPFVLDVSQPTPAIGFNNKERLSFLDRIADYKPDVTMALALIHHMSISSNIPFSMSAEFFAKFSDTLIIEFPHREDSWVERLLRSKVDFESYFDFYDRENFEKAYLKLFNLVEKIEVKEAQRTLYLLKRR